MIRVEEVLKTKESKINFLKALIRVAKSDQIVTESEKGYLYSAARNLGFSEEEINSLKKYWDEEDISVVFSNRKESMFTIMQIIQLCWIDGEYVDAEKEAVRSLADEIGLSKRNVEDIEDWVSRGMEWTREGDKMLDQV